MSDYAIRVSDLGKRYRIRRAAERQRYVALRDVITDGVKGLLSRRRRLAKEDFWALHDVSLDIRQGEVAGIIGRNGAGKSTLLKLLSRITEPTQGRIEITGRVASLLEVGTGFHPELTGRENIYLNGAILGMKRAEIRRQFDAIVAFAEVDQFLDTPVKRFSSGMYVRLAFAVAAHLEPEVLIVDEVLAVGDAEFQKKCLGRMRDVSKSGRTVLFVSHNMNAIEELCERAFLLERGALVAEGRDVGAVIRSYLFAGGAQTEKGWVNEAGEFENPWFYPTRFFLCDQAGNAVGNVQRKDAQLFVQIDGVIEKEDSGLCVGIALYTESGALLFWSYQTDQPEARQPRMAAGSCSLRAAIPVSMLNEGAYRLELIACLHYRTWLCQSAVNAPSIHLHVQGGLSESAFWLVKRPGLLGPTIDWSKVE